MKSIIVILLLLCTVKTFAQSKEAIKFYKSSEMSFENLLKLAKSKNKQVFVDVSTVWCGPCKILERDTFTNPSLIRKLNAKFICFKADGDDLIGRNIIQKYRVESYPTLLFLQNDGELLSLSEGVIQPKSLIEIASDVLKRK